MEISSGKMEAIKCMLVGSSKVGKTDLFLTFISGSPAKSYEPTVFDTFNKEVTIEGKGSRACTVGLWDSSGDSLYDEIRPISYPHTDCFLLCYAIDDKASYEAVTEKWKPEVVRFGDGPSVPIILVALKCDLRQTNRTEPESEGNDNSSASNLISTEEGESLKTEIGAKAFFECSTKSGENVQEILQSMVESALSKKQEEERPPNPIWGFEDLKILLVGDSTVGKSSILRAYTAKRKITEHDPTTEIEPHYKDVVKDGIEFFLGLYDLPSAPEYLMDRVEEYRKANGVIFCYAVNDPFSFQNLGDVWIPELKQYCPDVPFIVVGNKMDLKKSTAILIPKEDGEELVKVAGGIGFLECSAKSMENVGKVFATALLNFRKKCDLKLD